MSGGPSVTLPSDPKLTQLPLALDAKRMLPLVADAAGVPQGERDALTVEVLKHSPGQRCAISYAVGGRQVIGKLYRSKRRAAANDRRMRHVASAFESAGALRVPAPLGLVPELGLVFQAGVPGVDLRHALAAGDADTPISLAARWLARLHATAPPPGLKATTTAHELEKAERWLSDVAHVAEPSDGERIRGIADGLRAIAAELPRHEGALIHKDYYYAHVLWDGKAVWVLDFDQLSTGDPAFDVGHFLAHLENLSYRKTGRSETYERNGALFRETYERKTGASMAGRLTFYRAYTFVKLAATEAHRQRGEWRTVLAALIGLAYREFEAPVKHSSRRR